MLINLCNEIKIVVLYGRTIELLIHILERALYKVDLKVNEVSFFAQLFDQSADCRQNAHRNIHCGVRSLLSPKPFT